MVVAILAAAACAGAENLNDFSRLEKHVGDEVSAETSDGQQVAGKLMRAEPSRIVIYQAGAPISLQRESVKKVTRNKSRHTVAWVADMTAAGLGAGFLIGLRGFDDAVNANGKIAAASLGGAGAGAAAGFALSRMGKGDHVIYQMATQETSRD